MELTVSAPDSPPLMKDGLNTDAIQRIGRSLAQVVPGFNAKRFHKSALNGIDALELKQRVHHIIQHLHQEFEHPYKKLSRYLQDLPDVWDAGRETDNKAMFAAWPVIDYVATHGLQHPKESLQTLGKLTSLFTAEFAIRPFIQQHYQQTYSQLLKWCEDDSEHLRRLASEGSRPRLPWGIRLPQFIQDPQPLKPILQKLNHDESLYVRRSVANNINDISKDNPDWAIGLCEEFLSNQNEKTEWIVKHALRSLIKSGDQRVFPLLGYSKNVKVEIKNFALDKKTISVGDSLTFSFLLSADKTQQLVVDYLVYFMKANGSLSAKVFKLKNIELKKGMEILFEKRHSFKPITTRSYYSGLHQVAIQINGKEIDRLDFMLR
jgi:3-methyladenine DNA glycosylase AlkC